MHKLFSYLRGIKFCEFFSHGGSSLLTEENCYFGGDNYNYNDCPGDCWETMRGCQGEENIFDFWFFSGGGYGDGLDGFQGDSESSEEIISLEFTNE
jgi:hypothetical protein